MTESAAPAGNHKFTTLDALRGVAALAVVLYHSGSLSAHLFRHAYLAVDFFFALSGFVLSYAYGDRLQKGWPVAKFARVRFIRLFPLSTLGLLLGVAVTLSGVAGPAVHQPWPRVVLAMVLNVFFLPAHISDPKLYLFPFNPVAWSLFFELFSNLVHAVFLRRARTPVLIALAALTGIPFLFRVVQHGTADIGYSNLLQPDGFLRVLFSYTIGMLLFRLWRSGRLRMSISPAVMCLALILLLAAPIPLHQAGVIDAALILFAFPVIVYVSAFGREDTYYAHILQWLGTASYGIYVLQTPLLSLLNFLLVRLTGRGTTAWRPWSAPAVLVIVIGAALLADEYFDVPLRRWIRRQRA